MLVELWHHWMLLRPLLVFGLAAPILVVAVLFRARREARGSERNAEQAPALAGAAGDGHPGTGPQSRAEASPRQWQVGAAGSARRAA